MTVFLTTQYLEEADKPPTASESSTTAASWPRALRTSSSVRSAPTSSSRWSTATPRSRALALQPLAGVERVDVNGNEVTAAVSNGPEAISPVAIALAGAGEGLRVRELSLRTPTLDDVFLSVTGARLADRDTGTDGDDIYSKAEDGW